MSSVYDISQLITHWRFNKAKSLKAALRYSLLKAGTTTSSGVDSVMTSLVLSVVTSLGLSVETSLMALRSFSMNDSSRIFCSSLVIPSSSSSSSSSSTSTALSVVASLRRVALKLLVVVVVVVVGTPGQSRMSGHSLVSACSPSQGWAPSPTGAWMMNLVRVWTPPAPQLWLHLLQGLSSDQRQSTRFNVNAVTVRVNGYSTNTKTATSGV